MTTILIIDDDRHIRSILRHMLERAGYTVMEASNGHEGVQHVRGALPDLIITDIFMPEKEGLETIRELRRLCPESKILAISGGGRTGALDFLGVAEKLGAQRTLRKPFLRQELLEAVRELV